VTIPLLDLADVTAEAVLAAGLTTVGLLGTAFTSHADVPDDPAADPAACPSRRRASARTGCHKAVRVISRGSRQGSNR
jgi:aspartate racemase